MTQEPVLLGVDGGGTATKAVVARAAAPERVLGQASAGPGNLHVHGDAALHAVEDAVRSCREAAGLRDAPCAAACLALAGAGRRADRERVHSWARERSLAKQVTVVADPVPVLARVATEGPGIALLSGTGSIALGKSGTARARAGGLGPRLGDAGSGHAIALEALQRVAGAAGQRPLAVALTERLLAHLDLRAPRDLLTHLKSSSPHRIARLASVVLQAAEEHDPLATAILEQAAEDLVQLVESVMQQLGLAADSYDLAVAGGVLLHGTVLRERVLSLLEERGRSPRSTLLADHPAADCLRVAARLLEGRWHEEEWNP